MTDIKKEFNGIILNDLEIDESIFDSINQLKQNTLKLLENKEESAS
jgi:hypothetical protein